MLVCPPDPVPVVAQPPPLRAEARWLCVPPSRAVCPWHQVSGKRCIGSSPVAKRGASGFLDVRSTRFPLIGHRACPLVWERPARSRIRALPHPSPGHFRGTTSGGLRSSEPDGVRPACPTRAAGSRVRRRGSARREPGRRGRPGTGHCRRTTGTAPHAGSPPCPSSACPSRGTACTCCGPRVDSDSGCRVWRSRAPSIAVATRIGGPVASPPPVRVAVASTPPIRGNARHRPPIDGARGESSTSGGQIRPRTRPAPRRRSAGRPHAGRPAENAPRERRREAYLIAL